MTEKAIIPQLALPQYVRERSLAVSRTVLADLDRVVMCDGDPGVEGSITFKMRDGVALRFTAILERVDHG